MVLKRKRSSEELSSSPSSFSSSPILPGTMDMDHISPAPFAAFSSHFTPSHLPSRTMKRFRDNRPSQDAVHQHTLSMLYSAQQHSDADFAPTSPSPMPRILERPAQPAPTAQRSLHAFWNINSAPAAPSFTPSASQTCHETLSCEDCGVGFGSRDGTDSMDINGYGFDSEDDHLCGASGRPQRSSGAIRAREMALEAVGLGLGATQFAAELAVTIVKLKRLWDEVQDVPDHIQSILEELEDVDLILQDVEEQINRDEIPDELKSTILPRVLRSTQRAYRALEELVESLDRQIVSSRGFRRRLVSVRIVIKKPVLEKMESQLRRALDILNMAINSYTMAYTRISSQVIINRLPLPAPPQSGPARHGQVITTIEPVPQEVDIAKKTTPEEVARLQAAFVDARPRWFHTTGPFFVVW
ncbi:hypothetical protein D7B24_008938 [Verticillium nonalfalfae]|uniref:Uncharacterized protein n=1 Tax=Verticillium nonalfalfae TaxID=1051616 RepID=A0A3M9Y7L1_9PEZI|nr:uncharacterized protein D7B24_008938 [Verticillium nonalfalfae]RNJ55160.1 hypothetical protein D7B24_008938 [Verticillium nonalfalfae]